MVQKYFCRREIALSEEYHLKRWCIENMVSPCTLDLISWKILLKMCCGHHTMVGRAWRFLSDLSLFKHGSGSQAADSLYRLV